MKLISIDPAWAKPMAYALFENGQCVYYDKIDKLNCLTVSESPVEMIITEDPYPGGKIRIYSYKGYSETFKKLCFAVGMVIQFADSINAEYRLIRPVDWKTYWSLTKNTPEELQHIIRTEITQVADNEDVQDAILIGKYYIEHVKLLEGA